jgi:hypothetical protein
MGDLVDCDTGQPSDPRRSVLSGMRPMGVFAKWLGASVADSNSALPVAYNCCTTPDYLASDRCAGSQPFPRPSEQRSYPHTPIRTDAATETRGGAGRRDSAPGPRSNRVAARRGGRVQVCSRGRCVGFLVPSCGDNAANAPSTRLFCSTAIA